MRHMRERDLPAPRDHALMRQLKFKDLPAAADILGTSFIIATIVAALLWSFQLHRFADERDYLIRTIVFEATGETELGKVAVAYAVVNRKTHGRWGDTIKAVVTAPGQFEPWMTRRKAIENLFPDDPRYRSAAIVADKVLSGRVADPTAGATHFLNPTIVRARREDGALPKWASGEGQAIGRHVFYAPDGRPRSTQATLNAGVGGETGFRLSW